MIAMPATATMPADPNRHNGLHKLLSVVFEPSLVATPLIFTFVYTRRHLFTLDLATVYMVLGLFGAVIPGVYTVALYKAGRIGSLFYSRKRDRAYFYPMMLFCELCVFFFFAWASTSRALPGAAFAGIAVGAGLALLTPWHKVSYHVAGLGGGMSIALALLGAWGFVFLPIMVLVAYARVRLREHTWLEVTIGGLYGMVSAAVAYQWFLEHGDLLIALVRA